jgi:hypothetical protein
MTKPDNVSDYTVAELIKALKQFPQDLPIVVSGYESGFENILEPRIEKLEQNAENKYYDGEFQELNKQGTSFIEAVVLRRKFRDV